MAPKSKPVAAYITVTATHNRNGRVVETRTVSAADLPGHLRQLDREGAGYTQAPAMCEDCNKPIGTHPPVLAWSGPVAATVQHVHHARCWREGIHGEF